ncbi:hypothetical protein ACFPB1_22865 [Paenibacillus sp. GCM10023250]
MRTTSRPDLEVSGIGHAGGGEYYAVKLDGVCKVGGTVDCLTFEANGMTAVDGDVRAEQRLESNGKFTCFGALQSSGGLKLEGQITVNGPMRAERLDLNGYAKVRGDCEALQAKVRGAMIIEGRMTGDELDVKLEGPFEAENIRARHIAVRHSGKGGLRKLLDSLMPAWQARLNARVIEGDIVELEETTAETVRGRTVIVGPGCSIDCVAYSSDLVVHPQAQVRTSYRVES